MCAPFFIKWNIKNRPYYAQTVKVYHNFFLSHLFFDERHNIGQANPWECLIKLQFSCLLLTESFPPFICFRTQIHFTVAIDFTASNGECFDCYHPVLLPFPSSDVWLWQFPWIKDRNGVFSLCVSSFCVFKKKKYFPFLLTLYFLILY